MAAESTGDGTLTDYERAEVAKVAAWKGEHPNPFGELFRKAAHPVAKAVESLIPDRIALVAIESAYRAAGTTATHGDIKRQAGVSEISELRTGSLERCDQLSRQVGRNAQGIAAFEGAATGAGGVFTTLVDIPLLFGLCLRTIIKTGHCYGYAMDQPKDKAWVLGAFAVALSRARDKRMHRIRRLREIEELVLEETQQDVMVDEAVALLTQLEIFEEIPLFGAVTGALTNLSVAHRTQSTARHLFQERWLRDNGKVSTIEPSANAHLPSHVGWRGAFARVGYATIYGASFGAVFPVRLAAATLAVAGQRFGLRRRGDARASNGRVDANLGANATGPDSQTTVEFTKLSPA
jgi:hypothetical protein